MEIEGIKNVYKRIGEIQNKINSIQTRFVPKSFLEQVNTLNKEKIESESKDKINPVERYRKERTETDIGKYSKKELLNLIEDIAEKEGVSPNLIKAIVKVESNFNPKALSPKGAYGLMQLMPNTAELLNVDRENPEENLLGGIHYLKTLALKYKDLDKVLAAYNAGPGNVDKYNGVPPFTETKNYIKKIKKILNQLED
ncbi:MAG: lytic transglycosylase domain-containing protein [Leptospiraceae bacterium]|nr:lytic transglycosylase domain-containing protein [Leptospiraceae bacterium]